MAVVWEGGSRPSRSETLYILVRNGRSMSKDSLMSKFGAGSSSQLFDGALLIKLRTNYCEHALNEVKEQSVGLNTGGAEPAVSDRLISTFCSRKLRKSEAENVDKLVVCFDGSPSIVETDRHSVFWLDELDPTIFTQYPFSLVLKAACLSRRARIQASLSTGCLVRR